MNNLKQFIYRVLNERFRERLGGADIIHFDDDEYDDEEKAELKAMCHSIAANGYEWLETYLRSGQLCRQNLNTAAEYGVFVSGELAPSYLGVFVASQMLMKPFASAGYCNSMMRSEVFRESDLAHKNLARLLILLATFVPNKIDARPTCLQDALEDLDRLAIEDADIGVALVLITQCTTTVGNTPAAGPDSPARPDRRRGEDGK